MGSKLSLAGRINEDNAKWFTLGAACFGLFMAILDNLVVNIAMPTIARDLNAKTTQLQWVVSAYTLVFASLQITAGGLGDRLGRKRWFMTGLVVFTATSIIAAFSQSIEMLIVARALQGLGAALIMPLSLSLISAAFPPEERGKAVGIWGAISVSGIALGPVVGGLLVQYASWHWVFLINVPIGIGAFFITRAVVTESRDESGTVATDVPGTILITAAIASLTWGLIQAGDRGWGDSLILAALIGAVVIGLVFVYVESRTERPMVPLRFFKSGSFTGANIDAFMISFGIAGVAFFMTLYQQNVHNFSAVRTGLALLPMVVVMMVMSPINGSMINRIGPRRMITFGLAVAGAGILLFLRSGVTASYLDIVPGFVVMGFGMSFIWAPMTTAVLNSVDSDKAGVASAINGAIREIGTAFGIALLGTLANTQYKSRFNGTASIQSLRATADAPLQSALNLVGSGASEAGYNLQKTPSGNGLAGDVIGQIRDASSYAFVHGMDRAMVVGGVALIVAGVVSYFIVNDAVFIVKPDLALATPESGNAANRADTELAGRPAD
ncbi:MAG: MFS transporter [Thermomicrobiales bacterium]